MQFKTQLIAFVAAAVLSVNAQTQPPACVQTCVGTAITQNKGCTSPTDVQCFCTNQQFQQAVGACVIASCSPADQATALQLQSQECSGKSAGGSSTAKASGTSSPSPTKSGSASSQAPLNYAVILSGGVAVLGAALGAAIL